MDAALKNAHRFCRQSHPAKTLLSNTTPESWWYGDTSGIDLYALHICGGTTSVSISRRQLLIWLKHTDVILKKGIR